MRRKYGKILCVFLAGLFLNFTGIARGDDVKTHYISSKPLVLHSLPSEDPYTEYDSAEIFADANNNIIVLSSFGFSNGERDEKRMSLFVSDGRTWVNSESILPQYTDWHRMVNNGIFQAYTVNIPQIEDRSHVQKVSVYNLTRDMRLFSEPAQIIEMDENKKAFKQEGSRVIMKLLPSRGNPNKFFILGYYTEYSLNPLDLIRRVTSAGHWGFVTKPFLTTVEQNKITGYYTTSEKLEINENSGELGISLVKGAKIHHVGIKYREYCNNPPVIQYSSFDLFKNNWTEPVELFKGYKRSEEIFDSFSIPSLACYNGNFYCAWSWTVVDTATNDRHALPKDSGVYFCNKTNDQWNKPIKIADLGILPQVFVDSYGTVYIFWIDRGKGLSYKYKTPTGWSDTFLAVKDAAIRTKETDLPVSPVSPFGIAVDKDNNFHVIYIRETVRKNKATEDLVYVNLKCTKR